MRQGKGCDPATAVLIAAFCLASALLVVDGASRKGDEDEFPTLLINGFTATHSPDSPSPFEPVLYAPNRAFAFGFLRVGAASLDLAVVHLPSSLPLWRATPANLGDWSRAATLSFDSNLVLTGGADNAVLWQTLNTVGDTVVLLNSSNLVVRRYAKPLPAWQSFDHPADTLVAGQNFTLSSPPLISGNRRFALRMGESYLSLYMEFYSGRARSAYWQHTAREAGNATVYGRLDGQGFFGLYIDGSKGEGETQVDVLKFDSFVENVTGGAFFRRLTLDDDGNLRGYYWADNSRTWTAEYEAIPGRCGLPTACGAYGLCVPGDGGAQCRCLTNDTSSSSSPPCYAAGEEETANLCGLDGGEHVADFDVVRRTRVSVAYKERLPFATNTSAAACERSCAGNCSCWGAVHHGGSGYCYLIDFPVETMLYDADDNKVGYFKVRKTDSSTRRGMAPGVRAATAVLALVLVSLVVAGAYTGYRTWMKRRRREGVMVQELAPGPYKDLKSMASSNNSFKA